MAMECICFPLWCQKRVISVKNTWFLKSEQEIEGMCGCFGTVSHTHLQFASFIFAHFFVQLDQTSVEMFVNWISLFVSSWYFSKKKNYELDVSQNSDSESTSTLQNRLFLAFVLPTRRVKWTPTTRECQDTEATFWTSSGTPSTTTSSPPAPRTPRFVRLLNVSPTCSHFRRNMSM